MLIEIRRRNTVMVLISFEFEKNMSKLRATCLSKFDAVSTYRDLLMKGFIMA